MKLSYAIVAVFSLLLTSQAKTQTPGGQTQDVQTHGADASMHHPDKAPAVPSSALAVQTSEQSLTVSLADLHAMPQATVKVHNGHTNMDETYTGPLLADVLAKAGLQLTPKTEHDFLRMYVVATGTDGYFAVYSGAEVQPTLHKADVVIAIAQDGKPLTRTGAFQLIDSLDVKPARWVRNLNKLTVVTQGVLPSQP